MAGLQLDISENSLNVYKALANPVRLKMIQILSHDKLNVKDLANRVGLSNTITLRHLQILADADIITFEKQGHSKVSRLKVDNISVRFPERIYPSFDVYETDIPVGHYTAYSVEPSCGLAGKTAYIGKVDNPTYFMDPQRMEAGMIWYSKGFVEYQAPNYLQKNDHLEMLDLSMELGSEFPFSNNVWPSDITFYINDVEIGTWTSPGDFSDTRGKYTPAWVPDNVNQYGIQKILRITDHGSYLDGQPFTNVSLGDLDTSKTTFKIRFAIKPDAENSGGCTIFGKGFGNYDQDINLKLFYS
ncbi:ArsR family transcriptional regulator [Secundilactobacillus kimchicus JCM 15530]|uniref:ArsR family transcriptional regulator n=1 Tax=Secundilactobacillus kimchicus JCM 15530 TaxID=1302272 RepID=A0A0R1HZN1_9LACO|nr:ArsR family transcriptional regulator [Secundilactobacillus kimchicus JCM 15530]